MAAPNISSAIVDAQVESRAQFGMPSILQRAQVTFDYAVHFTRDVFDPGNPLLRDVVGVAGRERGCRVLAVLDSGVDAAHPELASQITRYWARVPGVALVRPPLVVPGGERVKVDREPVELILDAIDRHSIDRHSYVLAIGGGAVLDMAGFAAAIAHRGVRLIRLPTTVLAQNDSGVGVKNSVNLFGKKNFLGTFAPPAAVINDLDFLESLSPRDWRAGISEAIKVALLKDGLFFAWLEGRVADIAAGDVPGMEYLIHRCAELHVEHIGRSGDPFELGSSRPLDFGHWSAHKLEQLSDYRLRHGEAVAIGIALDTVYSELCGRLSETERERILTTIEAAGLPTYALELDLVSPTGDRLVLGGLQEFREHLGGELTITLLDGIGRQADVHEMHPPRVLEAIAVLRERATAAGRD